MDPNLIDLKNRRKRVNISRLECTKKD